ncbi:MAG: RHS domain-containing protein, partial [Methylococcales bacterium]|nr:RHS domain-containing protein [Methylococcales bacterium]
SVYYYHLDHLGTPQLMTDSDQAVVWQARYLPFGETTLLTEIIDNDLRFPGQYFDSEINLYYNYFRYYDPSTGRYITSDPIGLAGGLNTYAYVGGNPLKWSDTLGLLPCSAKSYSKCEAKCAAVGEVVDRCTSFVLFAKCDCKKDECPLTREDLDADLKNKGFNDPTTSEKGYKTYKHPDGTKVTVKPDGEVIRTQNKWKADGSGKYPERQDYSGNRLPDQSHTTGDYVK